MARIVVALLLLVGFGGAFFWQQHRERQEIAAANAARRTQAEGTQPAAGAPSPTQAPPSPSSPVQPSAQAPVTPPAAIAAAPVAPAPAPAAAPAGSADQAVDAPAFDVVRVEPNGDAVLAGRALPSATVELLRSGAVHDRVVADTGGLFAMTPPPLPPGTHELSLRFTTPDGRKLDARQSVTVVIAPDRTTAPVVALTAPGAPTVVLSKPAEPAASSALAAASSTSSGPLPTAAPVAPAPFAPAPAPASAAPAPAAPVAAPIPSAIPNPTPSSARHPVSVVTVESEEGGRLHVSGKASPGATVRLYLNDSYLASATAAPDGGVSFTIQGGVRAGDYRVRLDDADLVSGQVRSRAEVAYTVPVVVASAASAPVTVPLPPETPAPFAQTQSEGVGTPPPVLQARPAATPTLPVRPTPENAVVVPEVKTTIVTRGDSLWRISKRIYGEGIRYTVIYGANDKQIRDPDLIYPGQVFVVPGERG